MTADQSTAAKAQKQIARSADRLKQSAEVQEDSADRRTELAADRTVLAAERTYAAWVRTGLAALASGVGARALLEKMVPDWLGIATGSVLVFFAAFCFAAAVWRQMMRVAPPRPDTVRLPSGLLITVNGFLVLVCLAALVGIWLQ
jgi:putative membrane protein